jgi:oligoribonuclease NrnB/cAMP/cGMP phosphodiesterase (DHH superfamily)
MKYKLIKDQIVHITHNDSDALGCALVVDMYRKYLFMRDAKEGYLPVHNFTAVTSAKETLEFLIDVLNSLYTTEETGFNFTDSDIERFERIMSGVTYDPYDVLTLPGEIIISDLGLDSEILDKLDDVAKKFGIELLYVDHHTSNLHNHQRYPWCFVTSADENGIPRSACKYLLDIFKHKNIAPRNVLINYTFFENYINDISRYDTWMWKKSPKKNPDENYTTIIIDSVGGIKNAYHLIRDTIIIAPCNPMNFRDLPGFNSIISVDEMKRKSYIDLYMNKTVYSMGYNLDYNNPEYATLMFALVILPDSYGNDIMENIYLNSERDIDIVIGIYPNSRTLSFRKGPNSKVDLSVFARKYGGGGHKDASGAKLDTETFLNIMNKYYTLLDENKH